MQQGKVFQIICATGIACEIFGGSGAMTVHSFFGLGTAELPSKRVVERALEKNHIVSQVKKAEILIWDEISMSSSRILQLVNSICQNVFNNTLPFGGIQVVLAGNFHQLRPISNIFDGGLFTFECEVFQSAFTHRFNLQTITRQDERDLITALDELRNGICGEETENYFRSLTRPLPADDKNNIHIFFRRLQCDVHNYDELMKLQGETISLCAITSGDVQGLKCPAVETLKLCKGAKVMLIWNIDKNLHNGTTGIQSC